MTTLLLAGVLAPLAYSFGPSTRATYDVKVHFEGFLPLMGGQDGKVEIKMGVGVTGGEPADGNLKAISEIQEFEVAFNGAKLPVDTSNVVDYFPKTTITLNPGGKIITNDAPDKKLPIRLPGLDIKHFPDITYVPIEFPADDMAEGQTWSFKRDFGGAPIDYQCTALTKSGDIWKIQVKLKQVYNVLESPTYEVVTKAEDAVSDVTTTMTGVGTVEFDTLNGRIATADVVNTATSDVKDLKSGEVKQRKLVTKYEIKLRTGASKAVVAKTSGSWWDETVAWSKQAVAGAQNALAWLQTATLFGLRALPKELDQFRPYVRRWAPWLGF